MAYSRSRARAECDRRLLELVRVARRAGSRSIASEIRQAAFQGIIVQLHSALEEYFSTVLEDWVKALKAEALSVAALPDRTRSFMLHLPFLDAYRYFAYQADERRLLDTVGIGQIASAYLDRDAAIPGDFAATLILGARTYPSWDNIKSVFARIGIDDIKAYLSEKLRFQSDYYLRSLSDVRGSVTHMNAPALALDDVRSYGEKIARLVRWLDNRLWRNTCACSSSAVWIRMI